MSGKNPSLPLRPLDEKSLCANKTIAFCLAMRREHYLLVNGYSTNYWGWGGEDDDMHARIVKKDLKLERPPASIARYKMLKHTHQKLNPSRMKVLRTAHIRIDSDGVNNVKYNLLNTTYYHLFTHFLIDVGEQSAWIDNSLLVLCGNLFSSSNRILLLFSPKKLSCQVYFSNT